MLRRRLRVFRLHFRGRTGSWLALAGQVCALVGLPLPAVNAKDLSKPFPCQHRCCGCMKADDCWHTCCCFSAGARVAWAEEHGVAPPEELVTQAQQEESAPAETKGCCTAKKPAAEQKKNTSPAQQTFRWSVAIELKRCQGKTGEEGGPPQGFPPSGPTCWHFQWLMVTTLGVDAQTPVCLTSPPLIPPPRPSGR